MAEQSFQSLTVIVPSRTQPAQAAFLKKAVASIRTQTIYSKLKINIVVGIDRDQVLPQGLSDELQIKPVQSRASSQAAALNACIDEVNTDLVAFLEDDDEWHPRFLEVAQAALRETDFVSSTQLEVDERCQILRINDFPTPSGWIMPFSTFRRIGKFDEDFRWHLDNEWLGRLGESKLRRIHLVEMTAPVELRYMAGVRPWLADVAKCGGASIRLARHGLPVPLVLRLRHSGAGMRRIDNGGQERAESKAEIARLVARFKFLPF
jgi:glycosyltransferase involved in cell wall biosynthesis